MSDKTGIEWTDATWNPVRGCSLVSDGCKNCYAMGVAGRFGGPGQPYDGLTTKTTQGAKWTGKIMLVPGMLDQPIRWTKPRRIFVNSMSDLFHPDVPFEFIAAVFGVMAGASQHTYQVLTKRPHRMLAFFDWLEGHKKRPLYDCAALQAKFPGDDWQPYLLAQLASEAMPAGVAKRCRVNILGRWPLPNVWLGVSVEDQDAAAERIPLLLKTPAAARWISAEPLLGDVNIRPWLQAKMFGPRAMNGNAFMNSHMTNRLDWVVCGGESGPKARPMHPDWARSLRDQCAAAGVPFLFKQWGEWAPVTELGFGGFEKRPEHIISDKPGYATVMIRYGKKVADRTLDGRTWDEYPMVSA
ncbi:DUF5131 family protein [Herminiimonas sp. CN]|uniref:DUF5131 family protein n=1 Tax=Herminiimonas sp. CN TaxID=1349818 RepID=UPI000473B03D|nr:phage Gp37/Gp68 family protein [Herminiimonas sp. CN]